jgi:hypothetical protein
MEKKFYAIGNFGNGSEVINFSTKKDRDYFVAFGKADNRRDITAKKAKNYRDICNK